MTATDAKLVRTELNRSGASGLTGAERANSNACRVLSDAVRENGDERLADLWKAVAELLDVWAEHRRVCHGCPAAVTYAVDRAKFIALDYADADTSCASGCFLVEKATGHVWSIRGYGKKGRVVALHPEMLAGTYRRNLSSPAGMRDQL